MKLSSTFISLILLSVFAYLGWYFGSARPQYILTDQSLSRTPDLTLHKVNLLEFNESGKLVKEVITPKLVHIPRQDQYHLKVPSVHFHDEQNKLWHLVSDHAKTKKGFETIVFKGNVVMNQASDDKNNNFNLRTESLTYLSKKGQAFTNMPVELKQAGHAIQAQGMKADFKTSHILLNKARVVMLANSNEHN